MGGINIKRKNKMLMALTAFLILFVLIGSVSAAKDNTTALSQDTTKEINQEKTGIDESSLNKEIILKSNNENTTLKTPVSGDTFADIQDAIDSATEGDTIELSGLYKGTGTQIKIDKQLTVIGTNDATLDAQGLSRILNVTADRVTLKNINFINGNTTKNGGAIYWYAGANGQVTGCNFTQNTADGEGGAIYWYAGANGQVTGCNFTQNTAQNGGGAIYWYAGANGQVTGCNFTQNKAIDNGYGSRAGAISWNGANGNISNSIFKGNNAKTHRNIYTALNDLNLYNSSLETFVTISQVPDCDAGSSAIINITFDDGTNLGDYNVTLYNNKELIKTFNYNSTFNYTYTYDNLAVGYYLITVNGTDKNNNNYITNSAMNFTVKKVINPTDINVTVTPGKENATVNITGPDDFTGNVSVIIDTVSYPIEVINGTGSKVIPLTPGNHTLNGVNITNNTMYDDILIPENISFVVENVDPQHTYYIIDNKDMSVFYMDGAVFTVRVVDENKKPVSGKTVIFKVNDDVFTAVSDVNGFASVVISWKPGTYTISTTCENTTVSNSIQVKKVLRVAKKVKVKKSAKKIVLKAKLVNKLKSKKIIFKFKGKKYAAKTNKKGIAKVKIGKKVLNKLKVGKKYSYNVKFGADKAKGKLVIKK